MSNKATEALNRILNSDASGYNHDDIYGKGSLDDCLKTLGREYINLQKKKVSGQVRELEDILEQTEFLLSEIIATLNITQNRKHISTMDYGDLLLSMIDRWTERYKKITTSL